MAGLREKLLQEQVRLEKILQKTSKQLKDAPPGKLLNILVREYRCSGGTDTANPAAGNRCSGTGIPHLLNCLLPASLLA